MPEVRLLILSDKVRPKEPHELNNCAIDAIVIAGITSDAENTLNFLQNEAVDVIVIDDKMPIGRNYSFLRDIPNSPVIIYTDILPFLNPGNSEMHELPFFSSRALQQFIKTKLEWLFTEPSLPDKNEIVEFKIKGKKMSIDLQHILYFKSCGNYVKIFLEESDYLLIQTTTKK